MLGVVCRAGVVQVRPQPMQGEALRPACNSRASARVVKLQLCKAECMILHACPTFRQVCWALAVYIWKLAMQGEALSPTCRKYHTCSNADELLGKAEARMLPARRCPCAIFWC